MAARWGGEGPGERTQSCNTAVCAVPRPINQIVKVPDPDTHRLSLTVKNKMGSTGLYVRKLTS